MTAIITDDTRTKRNVAFLVAAQAILGSQMPMIFTIGGLAGANMTRGTGYAWLATLPISMIVFGSMTTAPWLSPFMQRYGRRRGFFLGAVAATIGAGLSALGLYYGSFPLLLAGSYLTGIYMSAQGFYRFAVSDTASPEFLPKAISYVMAGGLLSAFVGPQLNKLVQDSFVVPFVGSYLAVMGLNLVGMFLFLGLDLPRGNRRKETAADRIGLRTRRALLRDPKILVAVIVAMVSYALMNLVMTSTPLAVVGCGYEKNNAADIVSAHVLAMYIPSFFTGHLIARFGVRTIMSIGLVILAAAGLANLAGVQIADLEQPGLWSFYTGLILLGVGWNFGFIGATTLLSSAHRPEERGVVQGLNDMIVFGCVTLASLSSGLLMNGDGLTAAQGWSHVNLFMVPFLALAGGALIWLQLRPKD